MSVTCQKCKKEKPLSRFRVIKVQWKGQIVTRVLKTCETCRDQKKDETYEVAKPRNLNTYHNKMQSENFQKAERYRRLEKYNRRQKEKYLKLFYQECK